MLHRITEAISRFEAASIAVIMLVISGLVFAQVLFRYVFLLSAPWLEELTRFLMIWMVMLGTAYAVKTRQHIVVNAVEGIFVGQISKRVYGSIVALAGLTFSVVLAILAYTVVERTVRYSQVSGAMRIPMYWANGSFFVAGILMSLHYVEELIWAIAPRGGDREV